jgi:hypothetical protein
MDLVSGAVALNARLKDMPLAEGDTTYELKGGFNSQVFVMTGNVAKTPSFGAGTLDAGYLRTYVTGLSISGTSELPKLSVYNMQEGIYVTEPDTDLGWSFPSTIGQNIAVYSSQFDAEEVWLGEYFDGADKSVGVVGTMGDTPGSQLSLKDVYVDPKAGADNIFFGGDAFIGGGASDDVKHNLTKYFSYSKDIMPRVYVRPLKKNRMKGLWTASIDKREGKNTWAIYAPFWKWEKIQPILKFGGVGAAATVIEDKDATTNNTIFNHLSTSGDFGNAFATTKDAPLLESIIEISTTKAKTGGTSLRMYHEWQFSEQANNAIEKSLGQNYINGQVAKAALYDIPTPVPLDMGAFTYDVSSSTGVSTTLSGTATWTSGSTTLSGATVYVGGTVFTGSVMTEGDARVTVVANAAIVVGLGIEGTGIPSGTTIVAKDSTTQITMSEVATVDYSSSTNITGSTTRWKDGTSIVSGSIIRIGPQNHQVKTITNHYTMTVDRPPAQSWAGDTSPAAALSVTGPVGTGSAVTIYNVDTDLAKSFVSGAHLTCKNLYILN